ncbi:hypothetical protein V466_18765 [Pseudomonas mandelii PD30]|uniref:AAA+ ATPase domain-containing protein n=1 Tax=Pseudomonas mandelii PD30 TaxID=1419583 RepID=A0A059KZV7_9PSED|nr:AAA family ATPase [Pseudomonas mandelii]KDD67521.1 hypothetical protein V466_18765 [Pseudomonas mandelii PD30]
MRAEVMQHFGLAVPFKQSGYYETEHHKDLIKDVRGAVMEGRLVAICGVIGSGKTVLLRRLTKMLQDDKKVIVSKSVAVDKHNIKLATLIEALYYDLSSEKQVQIPKKIERRDRQLQEMILKGKKPIVMFVDEAHDLNGRTLTSYTSSRLCHSSKLIHRCAWTEQGLRLQVDSSVETIMTIRHLQTVWARRDEREPLPICSP